MKFSPGSFGLSATLVYLVAPVVGQESSITPTPTSSAPAQTHTISVGIDHKFKPEVTQAEIGDLIEFQFFPTNHSVVRAEYEYPCIPYEMTGRGKTGFFAGFHPVDAILDDPPTWTIEVNDTDPIFMYCSAPGSCITYGMVAVINPNANTSLEKQRQLAKDSAYMLNPGEPFPPEASSFSPTSTPSSAASSTPASSSTPTGTETTAAAVASTTSRPALSKGAIVGIAVAGAAIIALAAALFFFIGRSRSLKQVVDRTSTAPAQTPSMYQQHSFLAPKSDIPSSRSSAAVGPGHMPYDNIGAVGTSMSSPPVGRAETKAEYYVGVEENGNHRDGTRSPGSEAGYGNTGSGLNSLTTPRRHPSLAVNPNNPREMDAYDQRYEGWS